MPEASEKKAETEKSAFEIIKNWCSNSPSHGIRRISHANSVSGRVFWSIIFLLFTTSMCCIIYTVVMKFIANPTKINLIVRQYRDPNYFPAVTFCNLNPLRNQKVLDENNPRATPPNGQRPSYTDIQYQNRFNEYMSGLLAANINGKHPAFVNTGYLLDDLRIQCTFNGRLCHRNLTPFFHPNYGNCYTFDNDQHVESERQNDALHSWTIDDEDGYKLFLELFLHQNEYIPYLDDRAAFRVFIHRKHEIPILSQNSLFLAPTTYTKVIFSQRIISFSQQCRNDLTDDMKQIFGSKPVRYSQSLCFKLCELRSIEIQCQCRDRILIVVFQFFNRNQTTTKNAIKLCSIKDQCIANRTRSNSIKNCPKCLPECELVQYTIQSSYADYPNARSTDKVLQRIEKYFQIISNTTTNPNTSTCNNNRKAMLLDNIVAVDISASPYATEILRESPMYTWVDLISSIGGQTGLWIGVSLISFVEIAELLLLLSLHFFQIICTCISNQWKYFYQRCFTKKTSTKL